MTLPVQGTPPADVQPEGQMPEGHLPTQSTQPTQDNNQDMFPRKYVQDLRDESANYRKKAADLEARLAKIEEDRLKAQNEWKTLAEQYEQQVKQLEPVKGSYEALIEKIKASNIKRIKTIPDEWRSLVPDYDDPVKVADWLDANYERLTKPAAPNLGNGAGSGERRSAAPQPAQPEKSSILARNFVQPA